MPSSPLGGALSKQRKDKRRGEEEEEDLLLQEFSKLLRIFGPRAERQLPINQVTPEKALSRFNRLHSEYLPLLGHQLTILADLLEPSGYLREPDSKSKLILEFLPALSKNLCRIQLATYTICPELAQFGTYQNDDQYLKVFKSFRLHYLNRKLKSDLPHHINQVLSWSHQLIRKLHAKSDTHWGRLCLSGARKSLIDSISSSTKAIDLSISWLNGSELELVTHGWQPNMDSIGELLGDVLISINPTGPSPEKKRRPKSVRNPMVSPDIELARSLTPLIKLSRLFFQKLKRGEVNRKRPTSTCTEMSSQQLDQLARLPEQVGWDLKESIEIFRTAHWPSRAFPSTIIAKKLEQFKNRFASALLLFDLYLIPLIPDNTDEYSTQDYYRKWLATWFTQFNLAIQNFSKDMKSIEINRL
ncbi:hypothetical protein MJO28_011537 [Puccinia striiformis f. sp. tritici]|nr:hypothetical protein Pst134EA_021148 [Puccinia striiformis f. sp. tritici]KAH9457263.1 hypothetical protein Pst134EA_021148 [Puccinia striiformis f. sp. tritici]KAI7944009.1 hypothetical protein MJO28_011537 [Puccinia striiformis f. sp. tritici]KAI9599681.1 hypothetical protein KEM48_008895 [Puccinia striiformis f. sp. tritici PST-130]POW13085.1 hypothetical protein PSTT_04071 [Puccinia striiformis]